MVHSIRTLLSSCTDGILFPADPQNRLCKDHNAFFQAFDFHELVCSVHTVVDFKVCASKRNAVFR